MHVQEEIFSSSIDPLPFTKFSRLLKRNLWVQEMGQNQLN
jgi:hypothetical protein